MSRNRKTVLLIMGGVLLVAAGMLALVPAVSVSAQGLFRGGFGGPGMGGPGGAGDTYLAQALGISVTELQNAETAAWQAAVDQALQEGLITEAQATRLKAQTGDFPGHGLGMLGFLAGNANTFDYDALLAKQLGISTDALSTARDKAHELRIQAGLDGGSLTQDQANLMRAQYALRTTINQQTLMAAALGMSVDDLQTARQQGKTLADLMAEHNLTTEQFQAAMQTAYQAAVQKAVDAGTITADQAAQLSQDGPGLGGPGGFGDCDGSGAFAGTGGPGFRGGRGQ
jgi:hypothetical protein